ncbi:MAG: maleylpyruvate isomerase family mycothiol-dependent enzyme [Acidimicrobiales bacterium]
MRFPGEQDLLDERSAVLVTLASLTDDEFESGPTLCAEWAPRDVLAHLMGIDHAVADYVKAKGNVGRANAEIVERARSRSRRELMASAESWATHPPLTTRSVAVFLLGDTAVHHQDILRGAGRSRVVPAPCRAAILREGAVLGPHRLLRYRVVPDDGGRPMGRGAVVRGSSEALGMWLAGRTSVEPDLVFVE